MTMGGSPYLTMLKNKIVPLDPYYWVWVWVCPVFTDCVSLSHGASSQSNLFVV